MISLATLLIAFLPPYNATVTDITDGDTIKVVKAGETGKIEVRLWGIDAPEARHQIKMVDGKRVEVYNVQKTQPYGQSARIKLSQLIYGKTVEVVPKNKDRYGRTVSQIKADGIDINNEMVKSGSAWWYEDYAKNDTVKQQLQSDAQARMAGLWAEQHPMPPWEFRKRKVKANAVDSVLP